MIKPQPGPQAKFLSSPADIVIYGGSAGSGKSMALLLEPLRHINKSSFNCVIFRRTYPQLKNPGGLWHDSYDLYSSLGGYPKETTLEWIFPQGLTIKFSHLQHEKNKYDWQGAQIPFIGFDEITHFSEDVFVYMLSRNRSVTGVPGYIRATCNPDAESWVAKWIDWWIDQETGYPVHERSGVVRWFIRDGNEIIWASDKKELMGKYGKDIMPKSFTFIAAKIYDNQILLNSDPGYLANLKALSYVDRERLLEGNWKVKPQSGLYFKREYFNFVDIIPKRVKSVRFWDRAATEKTADNDPDYTVGIKLARDESGILYVEDVARFREGPYKVRQYIKNIAEQDGEETAIGLEQEPGASGKAEVHDLITYLQGFNVRKYRPSKDKITRAGPISAQCEAGNVMIKKAAWNESFLLELENFPPSKSNGHDDQVDAFSGAFYMLSTNINDIIVSPQNITKTSRWKL